MVLEFRPPFQIDPNAPSNSQRSLAQLNQTINGIGDTANQYVQQTREQKYRQAMLDMERARASREQGIYNYEYGDGSSPSGAASPSSPMQYGTMGPQPQSQPEPNFSMQSGGQGYVPQDQSSAPMPIDHTTHFNNWKSMGMPSTYDHPDYGGTGGQNPMSRYDQIMAMPGAKRRAEAMGMFKESDVHDLQQSEIEKNNAMAEMYRGKGKGGEGGDVTWHLDPFSQTYIPLPKKMGGGGGTVASRPPVQGGQQPPVEGGQGGGAIPGGLDAKTRWKRQAEIPKARGSAIDTLQQYDTMIRDAESLMNDPALKWSTGATAFTGSFPGSPMKNFQAKLETLKGKTLLNVLGSLKSLSANGSSGFGSLSNVEGEGIKNSVASLDTRQGAQALKKNIQTFVNDMKQRRDNIPRTFKDEYGEELPGMVSQGGTTDTGGAPKMKVINGVRYEKHGDQWYEASN